VLAGIDQNLEPDTKVGIPFFGADNPFLEYNSIQYLIVMKSDNNSTLETKTGATADRIGSSYPNQFKPNVKQVVT